MKIITKFSVGDVKFERSAVNSLLEEVKSAGNIEALDSILDTLWAPDGMTRNEWEQFFLKEKDHILARFGK